MASVAAIWHLREWDRRPGGAVSESAPAAYWKRLRADIEERGFESPLVLEYNPRLGAGYLGEGNHRLAVASELGRSHVPLMVFRTGKDDDRMKPMHAPGTYLLRDDRGFSRFPQCAHPSLIGLPVSEEPFVPAEARWYEMERQLRGI